MDIDSKRTPLLIGSPKIVGILPERVAHEMPKKRGQDILNIIITVALVGVFPFFSVKAPTAEADLLIEESLTFSEESPETDLVIFGGNTLSAVSGPLEPELESELEPQPSRRIYATITAYSSTPWETDGNPYITASGSRVREGIIANNALPFGIKVRIPAIYGDRVFVVEDRMNSRWGADRFDIWFSSYWEARNFGVKKTYIEIL